MHRLACVLLLWSTACDGGETATAEDVARTDPEAEKQVVANTDDVAEARPRLDEETATEIAAALTQLSEQQRPMLAAQALVELEGGRIPAAASALLDSLPTLPPEQRPIAIAKALTDELLEGLDGLCSGKARDTMREMTMLELDVHSRHLWTSCDLGRVQLMSEQDATALRPMPMLLAHFVAWELQRGGGVHDAEAGILRELARG
jgi:hypothetical protein